VEGPLARTLQDRHAIYLACRTARREISMIHQFLGAEELHTCCACFLTLGSIDLPGRNSRVGPSVHSFTHETPIHCMPVPIKTSAITAR
jgi:hypothetical protein